MWRNHRSVSGLPLTSKTQPFLMWRNHRSVGLPHPSQLGCSSSSSSSFSSVSTVCSSILGVLPSSHPRHSELLHLHRGSEPQAAQLALHPLQNPRAATEQLLLPAVSRDTTIPKPSSKKPSAIPKWYDIVHSMTWANVKCCLNGKLWEPHDSDVIGINDTETVQQEITTNLHHDCPTGLTLNTFLKKHTK